MKYGNHSLLFKDLSFNDKENAYANLGDNIISIAVDYIYERLGIPKKDIIYINKDGTSVYKGEYVVLLSTIGLWDSTINYRLPMSPDIYPIFISVVANRDIFIDRPDLIDYFKKYVPIGCRDEQTVNIFRKYGIESYLMGCHTICFPKRKITPQKGKVFFIDTAEELNDYIPEYIKIKAEFLTHAEQYLEYPITDKENNRLNQLAKKLLKKYENEAELIVTSRLHVATPCLAMGIPVIFAANNIDFRFGWLDKYIRLYSLEEYDQINWNAEPVELEEQKKLIINHIQKSIKRVVSQREELFILSDFYENREKTQFYKLFRKRIENLKYKYNYESQFSYIIWGAGQHCYYAYGLINEIFPNAKLKAIVDKYQTGTKLGVNVIKGNDLENISFDHVFITSLPGKDEAIKKIETIFNEKSSDYYTLIISQQKS